MNPPIAPKAEAANVVLNDNPAANPIDGAKNVLITDAKTTDSIFQYIFYDTIQKSCIFAPAKHATLAQLVEQRIRNA